MGNALVKVDQLPNDTEIPRRASKVSVAFSDDRELAGWKEKEEGWRDGATTPGGDTRSEKTDPSNEKTDSNSEKAEYVNEKTENLFLAHSGSAQLLYLGTTIKQFVSSGDFHRATKLLFFLHYMALYGFFICLIYTGLFVGVVAKADLKVEKQYADFKTHNGIPTIDTVFITTGYSITYIMACLLPFIILWRIFGFSKVKKLLFVNIPAALVLILEECVHYASGDLFVVTYPFHSYLLYVVVLITWLLNAFVIGQVTGQMKQCLILFGATFFIIVVYDALVTIFIIPYYIEAASMIRSAIRVVVIPGIFILVIIAVRFWVRNITLTKDFQHKDYVFLIAVVPSILKVYYMRVLYSSVSLEELAWNTILACVLDLTMKLLHWNRGTIFKQIGVSQETAPAVCFELPEGDQSYAKCLSWEKAIDVTGIWYATAVQLLHSLILDGNTPIGQIIAAFFIQYFIEFVNQTISIKLEIMHKIPIFDIFKIEHLRLKFFPIFAYMCFAISAVVTWRAVYLLSDFYSF